MPLKLLVVATALLVCSPGVAAAADEPPPPPPPTVTTRDPQTLVVGDESKATQNHEVNHPLIWRPVVGKPVTYILDPQLRTDADGQVCVYIGQIPGEPGSLAEATDEARAFELLSAHPLCQFSPPPPARPSPGGAAALAFEQLVTLPQPTMSIPPGYTVTGLRTYLIIGGPQQLEPGPIDALGYTVTLHITSTYDIDWGDGSPDHLVTGVSSQGGRGYPDGDVFHVYRDKGSYPVTVTQRWTATYDIDGGDSGTISDVLATTASMTLPVRSYQAVVTS